MSEENENNVNVHEVEARQFGWVPKEEFKGDESDWRDAETFLKRGKEINGFLRKDMQKIQEDNRRKEAEITEIRATMEEFRKYHQETEARAYARALEDLKKQKVEAIESGDGQRVVEIDEQISTIKEESKKKPESSNTKPSAKAVYDEDYRKWAIDNTWYTVDPDLRHLAELIGEEIKAQSPHLVGKDFLDEVTQQVKDRVPEKFENPNRKNSSVSSSSDGRAPSTKTKRGYNDLPREAKEACDRFVKQKLMTQEQYLAEYEWD